MAFYVRTGSGGANGDYLIDDLGFTVPTGASFTELTYSDGYGPGNGAGQFTVIELQNSKDLYSSIVSTALEWSTDGTTQRTDTFDSNIPLLKEIQNNDFDLYFGKLVVPNRFSAPSGTPRPGELYYDSNDGYLVFYDSVAGMFTSLAEGTTTADHGTLTGLADDDHPQYLLLAGNAARNTVSGTIDDSGGRLRLPSNVAPQTNFGTPFAGEVAFDSDDGYLVFYDGSNWRRDGFKADHGELVGLSDDDHAQYGLLAGDSTRNHVTGAYSFADGYLTLPVDSVAPSVNVAAGAISFVGDTVYVRDGVRAKWLSVSRPLIWAGRDSDRVTNNYLYAVSGATSATGFRMPRNGTITAITMEADTATAWTVEIRKNDVTSAITSLASGGGHGNQSLTINIDFSQGDEIQFYCNGTNVPRPLAGIEVAWRV